MIGILGSAWACGGLFCNTAQPVEQTAESLVFGVDSEAGTTTMHVQINYEGDASDFAWVLPLPAQPEVFRSTQVLFDTLSARTRPIVDVQVTNCNSFNNSLAGDADTDTDTDADADADADTDTDVSAPVEVLAQEQVGPYDTVTLTATDADALVVWLQTNDYAVPSTFGEAVTPYIGSGTSFLALKLRSGETAGSIEPLGVRWAGTTPSIPIRLTALAVADELPIRVYLVDNSRAVPENYFHAVLNPLEFDWLGRGLGDSVARATAEAGGHGFYTAFSQRLDLADQLRVPPDVVWRLNNAEDWADVVRILASRFTLNSLRRVVPVPDEYDSATDYYALVVDGSVVHGEPFDVDVVQERFQAEVVDVRNRTVELLSLGRRVTRLDSTMVASQMTIDPIFGVRSGLPNVSNVHTLTIERDCGDLSQPIAVEVDGEFSFAIPSENELRERGLTPMSYLEDAQTPASLSVQQSIDAGYETLVDNRQDIMDALEQHRLDVLQLPQERSAGCGCTTNRGVSPVIGMLAVLGVGWRRRRNTV